MKDRIWLENTLYPSISDLLTVVPQNPFLNDVSSAR